MPLVSDPAVQPPTDPTGGWLGLLGGAGALGGGLAQAGAQNNSASLAQQYAAMASQLGGFGLGTGPGGVSGTGNPLGAGGNIGFGNFNPAYQGFAGLAGGNTGIAGGIGAPTGLNPALQGAFGTAAGGLAGFNPAGPGMAGNADLTSAASLAASAGQGFSSNVNQQYQALQALQQPGNIVQGNRLGNSLFGNGMLGSSSGGILGQQFGQGLAQQSSADAAAAQGLGLQALGTSANAATGLTWMGSNALNSAFSNFGNASMLAPNVQSSYLNPALSGITGAGNLTNTGLGLYNAGLQSSLGQNQAAARAGYLGTTNANSPNQQSPYGQLLGNMFGGLGMNAPGATGSPLLNMFNQGRQLYNGYNNLSNLFGGGSPASGLGAMSAADTGGYAMNAGGLVDTSSFSGADLSSLSDIGQSSDVLSAFGPSAAGGEAATAGATAEGVAPISMDAANSVGLASDVAGGGGAAASGLTVSPGVAALPLAVMLGVAAHQNPTAFNQNYWNTMNNTLAAGPGSGQPNYGDNNALAPVAQRTQYLGALSSLGTDYTGQGQGNSTIPDSEWQKLAGFGITPQNIGQFVMPNMGNSYWQNLSASTGVPEYSTPSRQGM